MAVKACKDSREDPFCATYYLAENPTTVGSYCDAATLGSGAIALDSLFVAETGTNIFAAQYYVGMGVVKIALSATADCEGFTVSFSVTNNPSTFIPATTLTEFKACQALIATNILCSYLDQNTNYLYFYSDPKVLSTYGSYSITATLSGYDSSDQLITETTKTVVELIVYFDYYEDKQTTELTRE